MTAARQRNGYPRYRISGITHTPTVGNAVTISYPSRDSSGNPLSMTIGNTTTNYTYDANSRLVAAETSYAYDWVGNRNPSSCTYNAADQLTISPAHQYTYDSAGNLQYEYDSTGQTLQKTYSYTPAGLLSSVTHAGVQNPSEMSWDGAGRRVAFTSSTGPGNPYTFVYDATASIPAVVEEVHDGVSTYYVREPGGSLIARISGSGIAQTVRYYHFDELGSTRLLTNETGAVTDTYSYDAWGQILAHGGETEQPYQYVGRLGYYTHVQDANLPLLELGVRFYDPRNGTFGSPDRVRVPTNRYTYAGGQPLRYSDPTGFAVKPPSDRTIFNCLLRSGEKCKDEKDLGQFEACFMKEMAKCLGKAAFKDNCTSLLCKVAAWPCMSNSPLFGPIRKSLCQYGYDDPDPCTRRDRDVDSCQACAELEYYCCLAEGTYPQKCRAEETDKSRQCLSRPPVPE